MREGSCPRVVAVTQTSKRALRDSVLVEIARQIHAEHYGVRKMWHVLKREGIDIGREQTWRIMKLAGVAGQGKGRSSITTVKGKLALILSNAISQQPVQVVGC